MNPNEFFTLYILNKAIKSLDNVSLNPIDESEVQEAKLIQLFLSSIVDYINSIEALNDEQIKQVVFRIRVFLNLRGREIGRRGYTFLPYTLVNQVCVELASNLFPANEVACILLPDAQISPGEDEWEYTLDNQGVFQPQNYLLLKNASLLELPVFIDYANKNTNYLFSQDSNNNYGLVSIDRKLIRECAGSGSQQYYDALLKIHENEKYTFLGALRAFGELLLNSSKGAKGLTASERAQRDEKAEMEILEPVYKGFFQTWINLPQSVHEEIDDLPLPGRYGMTLKLLMIHTFTFIIPPEMAPSWCTYKDVEDAKAARIINCTESISSYVRDYCHLYMKEFFAIKLGVSNAKTMVNIDELSNNFKNALCNPQLRQLANPPLISDHYLQALTCLRKLNSPSPTTIFSQQDFNDMVVFFRSNLSQLFDINEVTAILLCGERIKQLMEENVTIPMGRLMKGLSPLQLKVLLNKFKQEILSSFDYFNLINFIIDFEELHKEKGFLPFLIQTHQELVFILNKMNQDNRYHESLFPLLKTHLSELITKSSEIITILPLVPWDSRDFLVKALMDTDIFPLNKADLYMLLPLLPSESQKNLLLTTELTLFITDLPQLMDLASRVAVIPGDSIKPLEDKISSCIITFEDLVDVLQCTDFVGRGIIINSLIPRIPNLVTQGSDLLVLIALLDRPQQIVVLDTLGLSMLNTYQLCELLTITGNYTLPIIEQLKTQNITQDAIDLDILVKVLKREVIPIDQKIQLVNCFNDFLAISLKEISNLETFLDTFPGNQRLQLIYHGNIKSWVSNYSDFIAWLRLNSPTNHSIIVKQLTAYLQQQHFLDFDKLEEIFGLVDYISKLELIKHLKNDLGAIISTYNQYWWFIKSFTVNQLRDVLKLDSLTSLNAAMKTMPINSAQLLELLHYFDFHQRHQLIIQLDDNILNIVTNVFSLTSIFKRLTLDTQKIFLANLEIKLATIFHNSTQLIINSYEDLLRFHRVCNSNNKKSLFWELIQQIKPLKGIVTEDSLLPILKLINTSNLDDFIHLVDRQTLRDSMTVKALLMLLKKLNPEDHRDLILIIGSEKSLNLLSEVKNPSPELKLKIKALKHCVIKPAKKAEKIVRKATENQVFSDQKNEVTEIFRYYAKPSIFRNHHHKKEVKECLDISPALILKDCEITARNTAKRRGTFFSLVRLVKIEYGYDLEPNQP